VFNLQLLLLPLKIKCYLGTNAALITKKVIENAFEVMAIELITIVQAIKYLEVKDQVSSKTKKMYDEVRKIVPPFKEDMVMYPFVVFLVCYMLLLKS